MNLVDIPTATSLLSQIGNYSKPFFNEFLPLAYLAIGILVGALIVIGIINLITYAIGRITQKKEEE